MYMYLNAHNNNMHNTSQMETTQIKTNYSENKQIVVHICTTKDYTAMKTSKTTVIHNHMWINLSHQLNMEQKEASTKGRHY